MTVYERIRERRKYLKMSQEELAKKVGYADRSGIAWIEAGRIDLPQSKLEKIAAALQTTPSYLMGWLDEERNERLTAYKDALTEKLNRLDETDRARIEERIDTMLEGEKYHVD